MATEHNWGESTSDSAGLIDQLKSEGRKESSGNFTMDLLAAQRKLTAMAQLEPGLMLAKIVQAAVVARAVQVRFTVSTREITAKINFPDNARTDQEVQEYMAAAFALAHGLKPRVLSWTSQGETRHFAERDSGQGPLVTAGLSVFRFESRAMGFWEELRSLGKSRRDAASILQERAYLCPIPVFVDACRMNSSDKAFWGPGCDFVEVVARGGLPRNRIIGPSPRASAAQRVQAGGKNYLGYRSFSISIDPRYPPKCYILEGEEQIQVAEDNYTSGGLVLCNTTVPTPDPNLPERVTSQFSWLNADRYLSPETTINMDYVQLCTRRWISVAPRDHSESRFYPVQDGLLLNPVPLKHCPPGCRVIMPVRQINLDLDQLSMLQDEVFQAVEQKLTVDLPRIIKQWEALRQDGKRATTV